MKYTLLIIVLILLTGCVKIVEVQAPPSETYQFVAAPKPVSTPGSLWTDEAGFLFSDHRARQVGDIVTVEIKEKSSASKEAATSTERDSNMAFGFDSLLGAEAIIPNKLKNLTGTAKLVDTNFENDFSGKGKTSRKEDLLASISTQVIAILPNGNMKIEGKKSILVNREQQVIKLSGTIRHQDIGPGNVIDSKYVLNSDIRYVGHGVISDKQGPGLATRVADFIWPF